MIVKDLLEIQNILSQDFGTRTTIVHLCPIIGRILKAHRLVFFRKDSGDQNKNFFLSLYEEWVCEGYPFRYVDEKVTTKFDISDIFKEYSEMVSRREPFIFDGQNQVLSSAGTLQLFKDSQIKSMMVIPLFGSNDIWGTLSVHELEDKERDYKKDGTYHLFKLIGSQLSNFFRFSENSSLIQEQAMTDHSRKMFSLGKMAASIAHEINNPIFVIGSFANRIESIANDNLFVEKKDELKVGLQHIQKNCMKITNIVEGLRLMSCRPDREDLEVVNINDIILRVVDICKENFQLNKITVNTEFKDKDILVECKPGQLSQVFTNFLNNSFDALVANEKLQNKEIKLCTELCGDEVCVNVIDTGPRLSGEIIDKIMEPFFSTKSSKKGSGLGLSICKEIIERFGGTLEIDKDFSQVKFDIRLPVVEIEEE